MNMAEPTLDDFKEDREEVFYAPGGTDEYLNRHATETGKSWKLSVNFRAVNRIVNMGPAEPAPVSDETMRNEWATGSYLLSKFWAPTGDWYHVRWAAVLEEIVSKEYVTATFNVTDSVTGLPIEEAIVDLVAETEEMLGGTTDSLGRISLLVDSGKNYSFIVSKSDYEGESGNFNILTDTTFNIWLTPIPTEYITGITVSPSSAQRGSAITVSVDIKNIGSVVKNFMVSIDLKDSGGQSYSISSHHWSGDMQPGAEKTMVINLISPGYDVLRVPAFVGLGDVPVSIWLYDGADWLDSKEFIGKLFINSEATVNITGYGTCKGWSATNYPLDITQTFSTTDDLYAFAEFESPGTIIKYVLTNRAVGYLPWTGVFIYDASSDPIGSHIGVNFGPWIKPMSTGNWHFWSYVQGSQAHSEWEATVG